KYFEALQSQARAAVAKFTPSYIAMMIEETTPGDDKWTPSPAVRDAGKQVLEHGQWQWSPERPHELKCSVTGTVFPNAKYPESIVLRTTWGKPQTLSFYGGEPFTIFGYKGNRPSFTGNIRARKVSYMAQKARELGEAYLLSGDVGYARACREVLLRFAQVYPNWLVHVGYGEYADIDPHLAALAINKLPAPELVAPPNKPDKTLWRGYWTAGRAGGVGQESAFVRLVTEAYDWTCNAQHNGTPLYSDEDKLKIERDLLLESSVLLIADKQINNKSVGNRTAAALVGMCVGHPGLVRFGLEGFQKTVDDWFLPDGSTPESPAYANMTLGNVDNMAQAFRDYSDPPGYRDASGGRLDRFNIYRDTNFNRVWSAMFTGLQGDLLYPPFADSYHGASPKKTTFNARFAELIVASYPGEARYLSLLKAIAGDDLSKGHAPTALYYREPGLEQRSSPPLALPDVCLPELRIGHLRSGSDGRDSLLLLSASHWGVHHHLDSLNLYYWKAGRELLPDLGYLWDHPSKTMTARTLAHNTLLIDQAEQRTTERGGEVEFFHAASHLKTMQARSNAYAQAKHYNRVAAVIDHGRKRSYTLDIFRVQGGQTQDYVLHGPNTNFQIESPTPTSTSVSDMALYDLKNVRSVGTGNDWKATWKMDAKMSFALWNLAQPDEQALIGDGWGQRNFDNSDLGATLPYIVRRTRGDGPKYFVSLYEGFEGNALVRSAKRLDVPGAPADAIVIGVETTLGREYIVSQREATPLRLALPDGTLQTLSRLSVVSVQDGRVAWIESEGPVKAQWSAAKP
ncbi:MAG: hypothetical protein JWN98_1270, partial [Abditibacteriota bacterium]|nr:hypothetical protein [Abditibacteriota bacterium]